MSRTASILQSSRREAVVVAVLWIASCGYTIGYCALFGYRTVAVPRLVLGMPSWVFWGVVAPWFVVAAITCWFALRGIRDEDLEREQDPGV